MLGQRVIEGSGHPILPQPRLGTATCRGLWQRAPGPRHCSFPGSWPQLSTHLPTHWCSQKTGLSSAAASLPSHPGSLPTPPPCYLSAPLSTVHSPDLVQGIIFSQVLHRHLLSWTQPPPPTLGHNLQQKWTCHAPSQRPSMAPAALRTKIPIMFADCRALVNWPHGPPAQSLTTPSSHSDPTDPAECTSLHMLVCLPRTLFPRLCLTPTFFLALFKWTALTAGVY